MPSRNPDIQAVVADREDEFERLVRATYRDVLAYALRRAERPVAEEVAADVFVVAWRRRDSIPDEPLPWLYGVARRTLANGRRSVRRSDALRTKLELVTPHVSVLDDSGDDVAISALNKLSDNDQELLRLVAWEELSPREAAAALGVSVASFRVRLHRARNRFARAMSNTEISALSSEDLQRRCDAS
jgi:RNA polymerase sigma-70 factor, ECF subfamily